MVLRIVNKAVVGKDNAFGSPFISAQGVDIAFRIEPPFFFRQQSFIIAETASPDTHARRIGLQRAALPSQFFRFLFGYKIGRQMAVEVNITGDVVPGGVGAVFVWRRRLLCRFFRGRRYAGFHIFCLRHCRGL